MTEIKFRRGNCASCGAMYKLPDSFAADQARCKECGGVVEVGPVETKTSSGTARPKPAAQPRATTRPVPAKSARPAAEAAARPATARTSAAKTGSARKSAAASSEGASSKRRDSSGSSRESSRRRSSGSSRGGSARGGSSRRRGGSSRSRRGAEEGEERGRQKDGNKLVPVLILLGVVGLGGGGWWYMNKDNGAQAAETDKPAEIVDATSETADDLTDSTPTSSPVEDSTAEDEASQEQPIEVEEQPEEPAKKPIEAPSSVDLSDWADGLAPFAGTTDEEWAQLNAWVEDFCDPYAAAKKFGAARDGLQAASRKAFPAILNRFKELDFEDPEDAKIGDQIQKVLLMNICNGNNFGWQYETTEGHATFNTKVVRSWLRAWDQAAESDVAWANLSKIPLAEVQGETGEDTDANTDAVIDDLEDF